MAATEPHSDVPTVASVFERIVCGVDETAASLEAVDRAVRLRAPGGALHLVGVVYLAGAAAAGWSSTRVAGDLERDAREALGRAAELAGPDATSRLVIGPVEKSILAELERERATLVAVGTHGRSRPTGILLGGVATTVLHEARCSVLVARPAPEPELFPRTLLVGTDGSPESLRAAAVAGEIRDRFGASLQAVVATGGKPVDADRLAGSGLDLQWDEREPVAALVAASAGADLLVVGSRGLHGLRALGSVSERVAHRARCSVLVVRQPPPR